MLQSHLNAIEDVLLAQSRTAQNAGHPNLRGGPREWFIRDFLGSHLPSTLEIGQGEIIDASSRPSPSPGAYRPQVDVIIYRRDVPKISYSTTDAAYLAEGAMATIESKSVLTETELGKACLSSIAHKKLTRQTFSGMTVGNVPQKIIPYVVGFDGPASMATVGQWMIRYVQSQNCQPAELVDLIVILGKGVLWRLDAFPELSVPPHQSAGRFWAFIDQPKDNLLTLFSHMLTWVGASSTPPNTLGYVAKVQFKNIRCV
jgi:hypothetical protein